MSPLCAVFDLDDTLYPERDYVRSGFHALDEWARKCLGLENFGSKAWSLFERGERGNIFDSLLVQSGLPPDKRMIGTMVDLYRSHAPDIRNSADADECLQVLSGHARLALVSDGHPLSQRKKIAALGLKRFFEVVILTSELGEGYAKPHPRAFLEVQRIFSNPVHRFVYVADNPSKDFIGPRSLGWKTIRIRRKEGLYSSLKGDESTEADLTLPNLSTLTDIILTKRALA